MVDEANFLHPPQVWLCDLCYTMDVGGHNVSRDSKCALAVNTILFPSLKRDMVGHNKSMPWQATGPKGWQTYEADLN